MSNWQFSKWKIKGSAPRIGPYVGVLGSPGALVCSGFAGLAAGSSPGICAASLPRVGFGKEGL